MRRLALIAIAWNLVATPALAVLPEEQLADPVLEARARELSKSLRCVVCQNQTIDDSDAPLAADLRVILRERLSAGDTDEQAIAYLVERYGTFVLLKPPLQGGTLVLWLGPLLVVLLGGAGVAAYWRARSAGMSADSPPLNADEKRRLAVLMKETPTP